MQFGEFSPPLLLRYPKDQFTSGFGGILLSRLIRNSPTAPYRLVSLLCFGRLTFQPIQSKGH